MAMLCLFHRSSMCRPGHCALMRSELLDLTTIISATACHQSNYVEPYSRFNNADAYTTARFRPASGATQTVGRKRRAKSPILLYRIETYGGFRRSTSVLRMDTDIALARLASGRAVPIGAEWGGGVHDAPPGYAWKHCHEKYVWTPVCLTTSPHHGLVWSHPSKGRE